nr:hypothetical protein [Tanacetum cinerariifolium]
MMGCTSRPVVGAAIQRNANLSSCAPIVSKMRLMLPFCSAKPNWIPRKPKLMFQICQKLSRGLARMLGLSMVMPEPAIEERRERWEYDALKRYVERRLGLAAVEQVAVGVHVQWVKTHELHYFAGDEQGRAIGLGVAEVDDHQYFLALGVAHECVELALLIFLLQVVGVLQFVELAFADGLAAARQREQALVEVVQLLLLGAELGPVKFALVHPLLVLGHAPVVEERGAAVAGVETRHAVRGLGHILTHV